jgi:hypothetical protein
MMKTGNLIVTLALAAAAFPAQAQVAAGGGSGSCTGSEAVGYIGISGIDCNCTISSPGSGKAWAFRTEPKITSLEMDSRAGKVLKIGDVITRVNGKLITTHDGAQELANIKPGQAVVLDVRRNGQSMRFAITADATCPTDSRLLGIYAPGPKVAGRAPGVYTPRGTPPPGVSGGVNAAPRAGAVPGVYTAAPARVPYVSMPRASFGMGISCSGECTMQFSEKNRMAMMSFSHPPEVYSIERGGPADKAGIRRGDLLTHINGKAMDTPDGGKELANVKPGETVRFTIRRGQEQKTVSLRASERSTPQAALALPTASLSKAREALEELRREQSEQLKQMEQDLRRSKQMTEEQLRLAQRAMMETEREHTTRLRELERELARADGGLKAAADPSRAAACVVPTPAPDAATRLSRTLRYSGTIGDSEIEVRGSNPVSVTENRDEILITTGGTVVRVKKSR